MLRRRAAQQAIQRILEANALEDLFAVPEGEAAFLYHLLVETAKARRSRYFPEVCRVARRRGLTPQYVVDRALVLLASIAERRRHDLYRILGLPALASAEAIHVRWRELARQYHPDAVGGGDPARFRRLREAYEVLRDPERRADYERFWLRTIAPFERIADVLEQEEEELRAAVEEVPAWAGTNGQKAPAATGRLGVASFIRQLLGFGAGSVPSPAAALAHPGNGPGSPRNGAPRAVPACAAPDGHRRPIALAAAEVEVVARAFGDVDRRLESTGVGGLSGLEELRSRLGRALAALPREEVERLLGQVQSAVERLSLLADSLRRLQSLKRRFENAH